jgi:hypothetical protein
MQNKKLYETKKSPDMKPSKKEGKQFQPIMFEISDPSHLINSSLFNKDLPKKLFIVYIFLKKVFDLV